MISVIITTYKRPKAIVERAINTVINQSYSNWELIIVDDSPSDFNERQNIEQMVGSLTLSDSRIRYIKHERNMGACAARNTGLSASKGEYIAYLDDDDEWANNKLEVMYKKISECSGKVALIYCGSIYVNDDTNVKRIKPTIYKKGKVFDDLIMRNFIGGTSFPLIRTSALREIGGFDEKMKASQDLDVWLRLAELYEVDYVTENLVIYHLHEGEQISTSPRNRIAGMQRKLAKHNAYLQSHNLQYNICTMDLAFAYAFAGKITESFRTWCKAVAIMPANVLQNTKALFRIAKWLLISFRTGKQK